MGGGAGSKIDAGNIEEVRGDGYEERHLQVSFDDWEESGG